MKSLNDILNVANEAYPDDRIQAILNGEDCGDGLALFIYRELKDTFDPEASDAEQWEEAHRVIQNACNELLRVSEAFVRESMKD